MTSSAYFRAYFNKIIYVIYRRYNYTYCYFIGSVHLHSTEYINHAWGRHSCAKLISRCQNVIQHCFYSPLYEYIRDFIPAFLLMPHFLTTSDASPTADCLLVKTRCLYVARYFELFTFHLATVRYSLHLSLSLSLCFSFLLKSVRVRDRVFRNAIVRWQFLAITNITSVKIISPTEQNVFKRKIRCIINVVTIWFLSYVTLSVSLSLFHSLALEYKP